MRKYLLYIFLLLSPYFLLAQHKSVVDIDWQKLTSQKSIHGLEINYFSFPEAMNALQSAIAEEGYKVSRVQRVDIGLTGSGYNIAGLPSTCDPPRVTLHVSHMI